MSPLIQRKNDRDINEYVFVSSYKENNKEKQEITWLLLGTDNKNRQGKIQTVHLVSLSMNTDFFYICK